MIHQTIASPWGPLTVVGSSAGLRQVRFGPSQPEDGPPGELEAGLQLAQYLRGERQNFDLTLDVDGTPWQQQVWSALATIPYGQTTSYGALAKQLGRPKASRAVGAANGKNPIAIIVPCHRVIGSDGTLRGYVGGVECKQGLLDLERRTNV